MSGTDPAHGIAMAFTLWWPGITFLWSLGFMFFIATLTVISRIVRHLNRQVLIFLSVAIFILLATWITIAIILNLFSDLRWRFYFMAFGEFLTVVVLLLGIWRTISIVREKRSNQRLKLTG